MLYLLKMDMKKMRCFGQLQWVVMVILLLLGLCVGWVEEGGGEMESQIECPARCQCVGTTVNCTHAGLSHLAALPTATTRLIAPHNHLTSVNTALTRALRHLEYINLRHNNIKNVTKEAFTHLTNLDTLLMDYNPSLLLPDDLFENNPKITKLSLSGSGLSLDGLNSTLTYLPNLEDLNLEDNIFETDRRLPYVFSTMKKLKFLELGANDGLQNISSDFFENLAEVKVEYLGLGYCPLESVSPEAFLPMAHLRQMDLSYTALTADALQNVFTGLSNSSLQVLHLSYVFVYREESGHISSDMFTPLQDTELRVLNLEGNYAGFKGVLHNHFFKYVSHLKELYLDNCQLHTIHQEAFRGMSKLRTLSLSRNLLSCQSGCEFISYGAKLRHLEVLDLSHNSIMSGERSVQFSGDVFPKLQTLILKDNRISTVNRGMFDHLGSLVGLDLSENPVAVIESGCFQTLHSLHTLLLTGSLHLRALQHGTFRGLHHLVNLQLNDNHIEHIYSRSLHGLPKLETLALNGNRLGAESMLFLPEESKYLKVLDLGNNRMSEIPKNLTRRHPNLKSLILHYNRISFIEEDCIKDLTELDTLDLSHNDIMEVSDSHFTKLYSLRTLNLAGNPFVCNCNLKGFVEWMRTAQLELISLGDHVCAGPRDLRGTPLAEFRPSSWQCRVKAIVLPIMAALSLLVLLIVMCLCYCKLVSPTAHEDLVTDEPVPRTTKAQRPNDCTWIRELLPMSADSSPTGSDDTNPEEPLICESPMSEAST